MRADYNDELRGACTFATLCISPRQTAQSRIRIEHRDEESPPLS